MDSAPIVPMPEPTETSGPTAEELAAAAEPDASEPSTAATTAARPKTDAPAATSNTKTSSKAASTNNATASSTSGAKKLGGKQVVLEYDTQAREGKAVVSAPQSDQAAIQKARSAYASGNQRLFAGDAGGAIKFYRQSLGFYPGYVAGYRGLGLAYAQQGDKGKALQALRMYVASVPTAKDAALIRKRISSLQSK
jgi:tetratricopeptide (TPR) repeat protein